MGELSVASEKEAVKLPSSLQTLSVATADVDQIEVDSNASMIFDKATV